MEPGLQLRVATFNIRNGRALDGWNAWWFRRGATAAVIGALGADVLGLQEVYEFQRAYLARRLPGLQWFTQGRGGGRSGEQSPIAVSGGFIRVLEHRTRWYGDTPDVPATALPDASFPRIATLLRCRDQRTAREFSVVNTHLDERHTANRVASTRQLAGWLDPDLPAVVMGDFNAGPRDEALRPLLDAGLRPAPLTGGTMHHFTGASDRRRIDHILASPHWTYEDAEVVRERPGGRLPSDHWPARATLRLDA